MAMVGKRFLLLAFLLIVVVALSTYYFYKSPIGTVANTRFTTVDIVGFNWSGQNEGETVRTEPDSSDPRPPYPSFKRFSLARGIEETKKLLRSSPLIPTLLPEGMNYSDVYMGPVAVICFSYEAAQDPRFADIVIEISVVGSVPSLEDRRRMVSRIPGGQLVQIGDIWVELFNEYDSDQGIVWSSAIFYHNNLYYTMSARSPLTTEDVIKIIESMKTP